MARRRRRRVDRGPWVDPWPGFVDTITIMAFLFLVMFATGAIFQPVLRKYGVKSAQQLGQMLEFAQKYAVRERRMAEAEEDARRFAAKIEDDNSVYSVEQNGTRVTVNFAADITFDKDKWELRSDEARSSIRQLAENLTATGELDSIAYIDIEGHADPRRFPRPVTGFSNWELSTYRAVTLVKLLQHELDLPGEKLRAAGRSCYELRNTRDSTSALNRRVEVILEFFREEHLWD